MRVLEGKVLDSVLIVHCKTRVRLENISEAGLWTKDETFWQDGKFEEMKKDGKVPPSLLKSWRALRRQYPCHLQTGSQGLGPSDCLHG